MTKVWGNHTFKFGCHFERSGENDGDQINVSTVPGGAATRTEPSCSPMRAPDWARPPAWASPTSRWDWPIAIPRSDSAPRPIYRGYLYEWFAQDSWKVTSKLHVDYGIRQTITVPYKALWGNQIFFDPALYSPSQPVDGESDDR